MANLLTITKEPNDYFTFVLNGDTVNAIKNTRNDLLTVGNEAHFKTSQGANLIKEQKILFGNITIIDGVTTLVPTSIDDLFNKLISVGFFDWINGTGSGGVDRFDHLLDTFQYFGKDGQGLRVNEAQLKLEPYVLPDVSKLDALPDVLEAGKMLIVSDDGTEYIFIAKPAGSILTVTGDMVDNTDPLNPVIMHDSTDGVTNNSDVPGANVTEALNNLDIKVDSIVQTTAGVFNRINFTGDQTTIGAGTFFLSNATSKGTVATASPTPVVNNDDEKKYFAKDLIGNAFPAMTMFPAGTYAGQLTIRVSPNSAQQRYTVEIYKTDTNGNPIASGVAGAPVGILGVTVITILDSGNINLADNALTGVAVSGALTGALTINAGERIRYHVSAAKVGTAGGNITMEVFYGSSYNSYYDVPVTFDTNAVINKSTVVGNTTTDALNTLNSGKVSGSGALGQVSFWSAANQQTGVSNFTWDNSGSILALMGRFSLNGNVNNANGDITFIHPSVQTWRIGMTTNNSSTLSIGNDVGGSFAQKILNITNSGYTGFGTMYPLSRINATNVYYAGTPTKSNSAAFFDNAGCGVYIGGKEYSYGYIQAEQSDNTTVKGLVLNPNGGGVGVGNLAGTGTRQVVADASGNLSATDAAPTSGTYTPTLTNTLNVSGATLSNATYMKVGNIVTVNVSFTVTATLANTLSQVKVSLPVTRTPATTLRVGNLTTVEAVTSSFNSGVVDVSSTTEATLYFKSISAANYAIVASFQYSVI